MTNNISKEDDYIHRLGKIVPAYIVSWIATSGILLEAVKDYITENQLFYNFIALIIIIAGAFFLAISFEVFSQRVRSLKNIGGIGVSITLYIFLNIARFSELEGFWDIALSMIVFLWVMASPVFIKEKFYLEFYWGLKDGPKQESRSCNPFSIGETERSLKVFTSDKVLDYYRDFPAIYSINEEKDENEIINKIELKSNLSASQWSLMLYPSTDKNVICVLLIDLGENLPFEEQKHWQKYNHLYWVPND